MNPIQCLLRSSIFDALARLNMTLLITNGINSSKYLFFLFLLLPSFFLGSNLSALYATLDPTSISQHLGFFELYPDTQEGKKALHEAWKLLNPDQKVSLPNDLSPFLKMVNRTTAELPLLDEKSLEIIHKLASSLHNRKLKGFGSFDIQEILALPSDEIDLARGLLLAELGAEHQQKIASYEASLDLMALQIQARLSPNASSLEKVRAINDYIFSEMQFRFPPHSLHAKEIDLYTFLPSVLDNRKGVCLGVSILYLCIAQRLNLSLEAITPPGHIYVRYVDNEGKITNIETTARGIDVPTERYLGIETKSLEKRTIKEVIGLAFMNQAAVLWHRKNPAAAVKLYEKASLFLQEDYLLQLFLGFNYVLAGEEEKGKALLQKIQHHTSDHHLIPDTISQDYLNGLVDQEGIDAVFMEVDATRESILEKQKRLFAITEKYPKFRQGLFHLAVTWLQLGREKEALLVLKRYVEIDQKNPTAYYYLAAILQERYRFEEAWEALRKAEAILSEKKHFPKALKELKKALEKDYPDPLR